MSSLDLSALDQFKASALLTDATGKPLAVSLDAIDFDPGQPRRRLDDAALAELADNIRQHGVLQPVSLRSVPVGRYIVNMGERRVRAARLAKLTTIPAFVEDRCDPYAQASENVHREELGGIDLAAFIAAREKAGDSRTTIARKLGKPASFITEVAALIDCPAPVLQAFEAGRISDQRVLYNLVRLYRENTDGAAQVLAGNGFITRENLTLQSGSKPTSARIRAGRDDAVEIAKPTPARADAFVVEVNGRKARMGWERQPSRKSAEVVFDDGEQVTIPMNQIRLISWSR